MSVHGVRQLRTYLVMALIIGMGALWWMQSYYTKQRVKQSQQESDRPSAARPGESAPVATPDDYRRMQEVDSLRSRDPESALTKLEAILAQPKSPAETRMARERHAGVMSDVFIWRLKNQRIEEALALRARAIAAYPDSEGVRAMARSWQGHHQQAFDAALRANDLSAAEQAITKLFAEPREPWHEAAFQSWQRVKLKQWREAVQGRVPGTDSMLTDALLIIASSHPSGMAEGEMMQSGAAGQDLAARGDALAREPERSHAAMFYWQVALKRADTPREWHGEARAKTIRTEDRRRVSERQAALRAKIVAGWTELAGRLARGEAPTFVIISAADAWRIAAHHGEGPAKADALAAALRWNFQNLERGSAEDLRQARAIMASGWMTEADLHLGTRLERHRRELREFLGKDGVALWRARVADPAFDAWSVLPADIRRRFEERSGFANLSARDRATTLANAFNNDPERVALPEVEPARALARALDTVWAFMDLDRSPEQALARLRGALRATAPKSAERATIDEALRVRFKARAADRQFDRVYTLAGFYVSELGAPPAADSFRLELRTGLEAAAEDFRLRHPMKHIYLLSLIGECFPTEAWGKQARDDAFERAFQAVESVTLDEDKSVLRPSGEPNLSFHLVDNGTNHHLLMFYRGPERAAVPCWPYRRGTIALRNGEYELAVISPEESIRPYRGRIRMESALRTSNYVVQTSGRGGGLENPASYATGDYRLLRAPPGETGLVVDPETGETRRRK